MANDLILQGRIKLRNDVAEAQIKTAILEAARRHSAVFKASEIDGFLESSSAVDSSYIELNEDGAEIRVELRGYGSHHNEEASAIADAFSSLAADGGHLLLIDDDAPPGSEDAITVHFVGATEADKSVARILYAMDEAAPYLRAAGIANESIQRVRESLIAEITPPEKGAEDLAVSLDGGLSYRPALEGVRVIRRASSFEDQVSGEIHLNVTREGIVTDLWSRDDRHCGTDSVLFDDIVGRLYEPGDEPSDGPSPG